MKEGVAPRRLCEVCRRKAHFYQFSRLAIAPLVGEVPSVASALPNQRAVIKTINPHRWRAFVATRRATSRLKNAASRLRMPHCD